MKLFILYLRCNKSNKSPVVVEFVNISNRTKCLLKTNTICISCIIYYNDKEK